MTREMTREKGLNPYEISKGAFYMGLNQMILKNIKPRKHRFELTDGKGLFIRITPGGKMSWVYRYKFEGRDRRYTIGNYPGISLKDARLYHAEAVIKIQSGLDPGRKKIEEKSKLKGEPTFADFLDEHQEKYLIKRKAGAATLRLITKDALPLWRSRRMNSITRRDVVRLKDKVSKRAPVTANRLIGALNRMFNHAIQRGVLENNPCFLVERSEEASRDRVLTDNEIKALWQGLDLDNKGIDLFRSTKLVLISTIN